LFQKLLLGLVVTDLTLGGNGYLITFAGLRIRDILYVACIGWAALRLTLLDRVRLEPWLLAFLAGFAAVTGFGAWLGHSNGYANAAIFAELKPLAYFPMLIFFLVAIRDVDDVRLVVKILAWGGAAVGLAYLALHAVTYSELVPYSTAFYILRQSDEFIFRYGPYQAGFLYKGMFYACIAAIFLLLDRGRLSQIVGGLVVIAVALTVTRSFSYALAAVLLVALPLSAARFRLAASAVTIVLVTTAAMHFEMTAAISRGQIEDDQSTMARQTDKLRSEDIRFIVSNVSSKTLFIGNGLGSPIRHRQRTELTYLEILHKQGLIGLVPWAVLFGWLTLLYWRARSEKLALPFFLSGLFVYAASAALTFLPGSIGMGVVFLSVASLSALARTASPSPL
jgi:hypothetical protein